MNRNNQFLLGALGLQTVVLVGMSMSGGDQNLRVRSVTVLENFDAEKATKLEIWGPPGEKQESIVLERTGNSWGISSADGFPTKEDAVEDVLEKLEDLRSNNVVLKSGRYHDKLEVSDEKYVRRVKVTAGSESHELFLGTSPAFKTTHLRVAGNDDVYLVQDFAASDLSERSWNWVDRAYVDVPEDELWAVELSNAQGSFRLERDPVSDTWAVLGTTSDVDASKVDEILRKARTINLEAPVGKTVEPSHGLDTPSAMLTMVVGTSTIAGHAPPSTTTKVVRIGSEVGGESRYYVKADDQPYVVEVASWAVKPLVEQTKDDLLPGKDD
ncbi:MAG: DUF4340 domain-containing protein [Myxococcales bacterium]|nr:DUF4340 domain-containing protein [Myxococcales bacterium]